VKFPSVFYRNWATFFVVSGLIWWLVPPAFLIFFPVVVVWIGIALFISAAITKAWEMFWDD
jgi:hypothetical protein